METRPPEVNRLARLRQQLLTDDIEAMLVTYMPNIRYLCGFTGTAGILVVTPDEATLYVDGRYVEQATQQAVGATAEGAPRPILDHVLRQLKTRVTRLAFEADHVNVAEHEHFGDMLPGVSLIGRRRTVEALRAIKDESEIALLRQAIKIADDAFDSFCNWIEPGMVESDVAARLEYEQRLAGGERNASGMTVVASGHRTSLPHGIASKKVIQPNEPVMIDIGTVIDGYCSDLTRTVHLGPAPDEFKKLYRIVYDAQQRAIDGICAGMSGIAADALARTVIDEAGYGAYFDHSLAHAIGLEVHERPLMNPRDGSILLENMVFTVEPGIYLPGQAGVRIEDVVRITTDGCEVLTNSRRDLLEL